MKHIIHTPTADFAYIETEFDVMEVDQLTEGGIIETHNNLVKVAKGGAGVGMEKKEFDEVLDEYLTTKKISDGADRYEKMNAEQQAIIQTIKRSFARTNK